MQIAAQALSVGLGCRCAGVVVRSDDGRTARTLSWWLDGEWQPPLEYALSGTPCADVYSSPPPWSVCIPEGVQEQFPDDPFLAELEAMSYWAEGFADSQQRPVGHVFVMNDGPLPRNMYALSFFRLVAQRTGAEFNRYRAELETRKSERRLRDFARTAADWYWETDADLRFTFYHGAQSRYPDFEVLGRTRWEFAGIDPADPRFAGHVADMMARRPFRDFAYSVHHGGKELRFSASGVPVFDEDGVFVGYRGTTQDITTQWETQQRLAASAERLGKYLRVARRLASSAVVESEGLEAAARELTEVVARELDIDRVSIWTATADGAGQRCLDRYIAASGRHESGDFVPLSISAADRHSPVVAIADVLEDPRTAHIRDRHLAPNGIRAMLEAEIWRDGRVGSLILADCDAPRVWSEEEQVFAGFLAQYAGRLIEAEARVAAERRLHDSEAFYRTLIENAHDDLSIVDRDGVIRFHSSSSLYRRRAGGANLVGRRLFDLVHPADRAAAGALLAGGSQPVLLRFPGPDGDWMSFELIARQLAHDPVVRGTILTWRDVTERLAHLEALRVAKEEAELANRSKSAFLANISHELRTPLNAVLGFSEIIRDQLLGPIGVENYVTYAHDIHKSGQHLLGVINDILDISKIEAGRQDAVATHVDVRQAISTCLRLIERDARAGKVLLHCSFSDGLPWLLADERHVRQIVLNLLSNAVKFTPPGGSASVSASVDDSGGIQLVVTDTGIGMSAEGVQIALMPFGQVENSYARRFDGTGLGLPLTKSLAELNGGRFEIESAPGHGTTVRIHFPPERTVDPEWREEDDARDAV